jgi:hypothetical protein
VQWFADSLMIYLLSLVALLPEEAPETRKSFTREKNIQSSSIGHCVHNQHER